MPLASEELPLSRTVSSEYYGNKLKSRSRKRVAHITLGAIATVLLCTTVAIATFINNINTEITGKVDENLKTVLTTQEAGKPFYLLLIGIDKDEGRTNDPTYGKSDSGYRSDSIMLTRIDPGEQKVTMVSIHRDTLVDLGENGQQKINAAYAIGQEAYTTQVISEFAGVPIAHYAEVDMDGLAAVIDSVGGIDVTLDMDVKDPLYTGIDLKKGKHHLDGHTAALFCRCRHAYDAYGDGDRYRAANQRMIISLVAKKILSSDPATIANTVSTAAKYIRTDMDVQFIISLAMQFIGMDAEHNIYSGMEPTTARYINNIWYELCDTTAWRKMMKRVDKGLPPTEEGDVDPLETSPDSGEDVYIDSTGSDTESTYYDTGESTYYEPEEYTYYEPEPEYTEYTSEETYEEPEYTEQSTSSDETGGEQSEDSSSYDESATYSGGEGAAESSGTVSEESYGSVEEVAPVDGSSSEAESGGGEAAAAPDEGME